jgi:hypothetical protein
MYKYIHNAEMRGSEEIQTRMGWAARTAAEDDGDDEDAVKMKMQ